VIACVLCACVCVCVCVCVCRAFKTTNVNGCSAIINHICTLLDGIYKRYLTDKLSARDDQVCVRARVCRCLRVCARVGVRECVCVVIRCFE